MSAGPLLFNDEEDKRKTEQELIEELSRCRTRIAALIEAQTERDRITGALDSVAEPFIILDNEARITFANAEAVNLFGVVGGGLDGRSFRDAHPWGRDPLFNRFYEKARTKREPVRFRETRKFANRWFEVYLCPMPDGMVAHFHDITSREQTEAVYQLALKLIKNLNENIFLMRGDGRLFHVNEETSSALGYAKDELIRMNIADLVPPEHMGEWRDILERIKQQGSMTFESILKARGGREFPVEVYANYFYLHGASYYTVSARNITERKRVEEALRLSEEKFRLVADFTYDWESWISPEGKYIYISPSCERITGYSPNEFYRDPGLVMKIVHPVDQARYEEHLNVHHSGNPGYDAIDFRIVKPDGEIVWISHLCRPVFGSNGEWLGRRSGNRDITERKQAEEALQVAKAQAELYVDLMSHDINNMNQIGIGYLEMLLDHPGIDEYERIILQKSLESLENSSKLIRNVQKLQRASTEGISLKAINATVMLGDVIQEFRQAPGKELAIDFRSTGDCLVSANELLKDVFVNLVGNAFKHARPDRPPAIRISVDNVMEYGKKFCRFVIKDDGPGIPDDTKERLFQRFSRGQTKAKGSGLGLYLVKTLVEHYGGNIQVQDRVSGDHTKGAKFIVTIPSAE